MNLAELCEPFPNDVLPRLDRTDAPPSTILLQQEWQKHGYVILPKLLPEPLLDAYSEEWQRHAPDRGGWPDAVPYMRHPPLLNLCCTPILSDVLYALIGEPMGVHLNLTGWRSTQRNWHQDGYLNPDHVADWYAAVWVALDDIHPRSGPFEYVPGTHRLFGTVRQDRMLAALTEKERNSSEWPKLSERILTPMFEAAMKDQGLTPVPFIAKKGDVLIWHARLLHRGAPPIDPSLERRAVIMHYSGIWHRPDMPPAVEHRHDGHYFPLEVRAAVG